METPFHLFEQMKTLSSFMQVATALVQQGRKQVRMESDIQSFASVEVCVGNEPMFESSSLSTSQLRLFNYGCKACPKWERLQD